MACKWSNFRTGICEFFDDGIERPVNEKGICLCDEDESPEDSCEDYEEL
jgi:hypothetical protein